MRTTAMVGVGEMRRIGDILGVALGRLTIMPQHPIALYSANRRWGMMGSKSKINSVGSQIGDHYAYQWSTSWIDRLTRMYSPAQRA